MRSLLVVIALSSSGCAGALGVLVLGTTAAVVPPVVGMSAVPLEGGMAHATVAGVAVDGAEDHEGGWGASLDTSTVGKGYLAHGKIELGRWGRDRFYGSSGAEAGVGMGQGGYGGGLLFGYGYGGFTQNGHNLPLKVMGFGRVGPLNLRLSGYAGWRIVVADEYPKAASSFGPGWKTFGAELSSVLLLRGDGANGAGVSAAIGIDRQDDVNVGWVKFGVGLAIAQ